MTLTGAIVAAISRKVRAFVAECRAIVKDARNTEKAIVTKAEAEVRNIKDAAEAEVSKLRNELINKITAI